MCPVCRHYGGSHARWCPPEKRAEMAASAPVTSRPLTKQDITDAVAAERLRILAAAEARSIVHWNPISPAVVDVVSLATLRAVIAEPESH
jgi:hypothetical protein